MCSVFGLGHRVRTLLSTCPRNSITTRLFGYSQEIPFTVSSLSTYMIESQDLTLDAVSGFRSFRRKFDPQSLLANALPSISI